MRRCSRRKLSATERGGGRTLRRAKSDSFSLEVRLSVRHSSSSTSGRGKSTSGWASGGHGRSLSPAVAVGGAPTTVSAPQTVVLRLYPRRTPGAVGRPARGGRCTAPWRERKKRGGREEIEIKEKGKRSKRGKEGKRKGGRGGKDEAGDRKGHVRKEEEPEGE